MIVTVTMNPSLDYHMEIPECEMEKTNRSLRETLRPGGKGINVSAVLSRLGVPNCCLVVTAGFTGEALEKMLLQEGIAADPIRLEQGMTRINVKLDGGSETELNGAGPYLTEEDRETITKKMEQYGKDDILVLAGSLPKGVRTDFYAQMTRMIRRKGGKAVVDASGEAFRLAVEEKPFLVKPNLAELQEYFGVEVKKDEVLFYGRKLQEKTEGYVLLSMGKDGAVLFSPDGTWTRKAPVGPTISAIGAGDSMLAGFLAAGDERKEEERLKAAVACGSASAFSPWLAEKDEIQSLYERMEE